MNSLKYLVFLGIWIAGVIFYANMDREAIGRSNEKYEREINDLSVPPTLGARIEDPSWSIAYWISADKKDADCVTADEYMDHNAESKTVTQRGHTKTYYLSEYIDSCRNRVKRALEQVTPPVRKWCAYRHTSPRLETLCHEWEQNKDIYISRMNKLDGPTLARYAAFIGK
ncbi:hypothetical protein [Methylocystis heyeri]|uniref:Uncharacterized protein n=1 Tax=Methylocystis heyeri TaxID=391905 RepID=A0A6B8K870_9HYPH|nr:hypothetical protein [Methylocystis heyeri]QGM44414.1 hypothetical protein H2LOC_001145 [Methylocystis heyeri]